MQDNFILHHATTILKATDDVEKSKNFNFSIIWDNDHDERIIGVIEKFHSSKILKNFIAIGEHKGCLTAVLNPACTCDESLENKLSELSVALDGDTWYSQMLTLDQVRNEQCFVGLNFDSIVKTWELGKQKAITPGKSEQKFPQKSEEVDEITEEAAQMAISLQDKLVVKHTFSTQAGYKLSVYGFPNPKSAEKKEFEWEKRVSDKFFRLGQKISPGKQSYKIFSMILQQIEAPIKTTLILDGLCRRSFVIAMHNIITKYEKMPTVFFRLGTTRINFLESEEHAKLRQKGNFSMEIPNLGEYQIKYGKGCITRIDHIDYCIDKIKSASKDFTTFKSFEDDFLNGLFLLVSVVEVLARSYRTAPGMMFQYPARYQEGIASDAFPIGMAQARAMILLLHGKIEFNDFFGQSEIKTQTSQKVEAEQKKAVKKIEDTIRAVYGAVTGIGTTHGDGLKIIREKLNEINKKFREFDSGRQKTSWKEFKEEYELDNSEGFLISGRSKMAHELREIYGSGGESDGNESDYSNANSEFDSKVITFKPKTRPKT